MSSQKDVFLRTEGDRYFDRNSTLLVNSETSSPIFESSFGLYTKFLKSEGQVLEIGCAAGAMLARFRTAVSCDCYGVDPSAKAIAQGQLLHPELHLSVGTADSLPFENAYFDFLLFGFCLYLVDREMLPRCVAEADRVLRPCGFVGITDFDPPRPSQVPYKHCEGVMSYKMNYSTLFTVYPQYSLVSKISLSHAYDRLAPDPHERVSTVVLYKEPDYGFGR